MTTALKRRLGQGRGRRARGARGVIDWTRVAADLDTSGWAPLAGLLTADECEALAALYDDERRFRSTIVMARHGFGRGEYKYFAYPLPEHRRGVAAGALCAAGADRQSLERGDGDRGALSGGARRIHHALPRGRPDAADAAAPASMARATTTACTRISTASTSFRSRW